MTTPMSQPGRYSWTATNFVSCPFFPPVSGILRPICHNPVFSPPPFDEPAERNLGFDCNATVVVDVDEVVVAAKSSVVDVLAVVEGVP